MSRSRRSRSGFLAVTVAAALTVAACADDGQSRTGTDVDTVEFAEFAGFPLPLDAEIVGTSAANGIDSMVSMAFTVPTDEVSSALDAAEFTTELVDGAEPSNTPDIEGIDVSQRPIASAQDRVEVDGSFVTREVTVFDQGDRSTVVVFAFTT